MCFKFAVVVLVCLNGLATFAKEDSETAETGWHEADLEPAESHYFQFIHVPHKDHYEHGHKRGNEHHFIERHEKVHPHEGHFKTKVKWGDHKGGYGEHYWDYNHHGHHDGDGEESQKIVQYVPYEEAESQQVLVYAKSDSDSAASLNSPVEVQRGKRQGIHQDVEFINDRARSLVLDGKTQKHGGNYRRANDYRGKREQDEVSFEPLSARTADKEDEYQYQYNPKY